MNSFWAIFPASPIVSDTLDAGLKVASELGAMVHVPNIPFDQGHERHFWLAGDDNQRAEALIEAIAHVSDGGALWMGRGGYGSIRTLRQAGIRLAEAQSKRHTPAPLWGFSDGTALANVWAAMGWGGWLAPPLSQLPRLDVESLTRVRIALESGQVAPFEGLELVYPGDAEGVLAGGNLAVLASIVGTFAMPSLEGTVLLLEDINEPAYRVDRLCTQLYEAGAFQGVQALVCGEFSGVGPRELAGIDAVFEDLAARLTIPLVKGLPLGHGQRNVPFPLGRLARLKTTAEDRATLELA